MPPLPLQPLPKTSHVPPPPPLPLPLPLFARSRSMPLPPSLLDAPTLAASSDNTSYKLLPPPQTHALVVNAPPSLKPFISHTILSNISSPPPPFAPPSSHYSLHTSPSAPPLHSTFLSIFTPTPFIQYTSPLYYVLPFMTPHILTQHSLLHTQLLLIPQTHTPPRTPSPTSFTTHLAISSSVFLLPPLPYLNSPRHLPSPKCSYTLPMFKPVNTVPAPLPPPLPPPTLPLALPLPPLPSSASTVPALSPPPPNPPMSLSVPPAPLPSHPYIITPPHHPHVPPASF